MGKEQRKAQRRHISQPVLMVDKAGAVVASCTMLDVSAGGARLKLAKDVTVPSEFTLLLSKFDPDARRRCALAWRTDAHAGVKFLG
jgi:hypothetical protein